MIMDLEGIDDMAQNEPSRLRKLMKGLLTLEAEIVDLCFFQRTSQVKIAEKLDVGLPVVGYRLGRAAAKIQAMMDAEQDMTINDKP